MITREHVFEEVMTPEEFIKVKDEDKLTVLYKVLYMAIRLSLNIRQNTQPKKPQKKVSKKEPEVGNAVIKADDNVKIKEEKNAEDQ